MPSAKGLWNTVKGFGSAVKANSKAANYINRGIKFGAIGGAVGGVSEWAQGGSFFEGAKSGALTGAMAGAGYTAFKAGRGAAEGTAKRTIRGFRSGSYTRPAAEASSAAGYSVNRNIKGKFSYSPQAQAMHDASRASARKEAKWAAIDERAAKVGGMRSNGTLASVPNSDWSAGSEMSRLGLPSRAQMSRGGVSKQVTALNQLYGDVALTRRANGLG